MPQHHRGLVITLVIAVVVAGIGIGVMALTADDENESVDDELATEGYLGRSLTSGDAEESLSLTVSSGLGARIKAFGTTSCVAVDPPVLETEHGDYGWELVRNPPPVTIKIRMSAGCGAQSTSWSIEVGQRPTWYFSAVLIWVAPGEHRLDCHSNALCDVTRSGDSAYSIRLPCVDGAKDPGCPIDQPAGEPPPPRDRRPGDISIFLRNGTKQNMTFTGGVVHGACAQPAPDPTAGTIGAFDQVEVIVRLDPSLPSCPPTQTVVEVIYNFEVDRAAFAQPGAFSLDMSSTTSTWQASAGPTTVQCTDDFVCQRLDYVGGDAFNVVGITRPS